MTKIKLCGLTRPYDIEYVNGLLPEYVGFVFAHESKRYISPEKAEKLRTILDSRITPVGVFTGERIDVIADLVKRKIIDIIQLHGNENEQYIADLREVVDCPIIKAFRIESNSDVISAKKSSADYVLLDSGGGTGKVFDHSLLKDIARPYFLAGGLTPENVETAVKQLVPFAVDASSSLETDGFKDRNKMTAFVKAVRKD
ncbi:MAG: phosphoribosylanthranilate isomerase [Oscillospiraceae bacterium]|nr:phosphoribosylanthranilate isomerase [Oscillospiraceae bacterium]MBQ8176172.1 phosphoribosylanthranilate isomerase [Oscillospiraceae bacterium]